MTHAKHTPGPWSVRPYPIDDWGWIRDAKGDLVAMARAGQFLDEAALDIHRKNETDPYEGNARLIAAAPALLEALDYLVGECPQDLDDDYNPHAAPLAKARAAIAKATGGQANA